MILDHFKEDQKVILISFSIKAGLSLFICILACVLFRSKPKLPPSEAATVDRDDDILGTIRLLYANKQFMLLSFTHLFYHIALSIMETNLSSILEFYNPSIFRKSEKHLNLWRTIGAVLGWFTLGLFLCLTKYYKTANIWIGFLSLVCWILIPFIFKMELSSISILYGFIGFWAYTVTPFWLIYSVEIAYPLKETTVVGIVRGTAGFISNSIAYALYYFIKKH